MGKSVNEYIDDIRALTGSATDSDLAAYLGKAKQTVSSWRRRGAVPMDVQYLLADRFGPQAALYGEVEYATTSRERQATFAVLLSIYDEFRVECDPASDSERYIAWAQAFDQCELDIRNAVRQLGFVGAGDNQFTVSEMVKVMIRTGKLPQVKRALDVWVREVDPDTDTEVPQ